MHAYIVFFRVIILILHYSVSWSVYNCNILNFMHGEITQEFVLCNN